MSSSYDSSAGESRNAAGSNSRSLHEGNARCDSITMGSGLTKEAERQASGVEKSSEGTERMSGSASVEVTSETCPTTAKYDERIQPPQVKINDETQTGSKHGVEPRIIGSCTVTNGNANAESMISSRTVNSTPAATKTIKPALKSSLKTSKYSSKSPVSSAQKGVVVRASTERRVRGLWNDVTSADPTKVDASFWSKLRDETMVDIFQYLNLADLIKVGMVSNRYRSIIKQEKSLWRSVNASEFVARTHKHYLSIGENKKKLAQARVGRELDRIFQEYHTPIYLVIQDIHDFLSADDLPSLTGLEELTLTHFDSLSDTHVHVLLLMIHNSGLLPKKNPPKPLRKLSLEHCPKLSDGCLRSIASQASSLQSLSLKGCQGITKVDPVLSLLSSKAQIIPDRTGPSPSSLDGSLSATTGILGLSSLFLGGPPAPSPVLAQETPETKDSSSSSIKAPDSPPRNALQGLFAVPGMSPPRRKISSHNNDNRPGSSSVTAVSLFSIPLPTSTELPFRPSSISGGMLKFLNLEGTSLSRDEFAKVHSKVHA